MPPLKTNVLTVAMILFAGCFACNAVADTQPASDNRIIELEDKVRKLESIIEKMGIPLDPIDEKQALVENEAEIYHTPEEKRASGMGTHLGRAITFGGLFEVEAGAGRARAFSGGGATGSDVVLATAQLGWKTKFNTHFSGKLVLLWEEDGTEPVALDEGIIAWQGNGFDISAGRFYSPFGTFNSHFITDPLTLELGETQQSGLLLHAAQSEFFEATFSLANGEVDKTTQGDHINDFGLRLDFHPAMKSGASLDFGLQYDSDIADSGAEVLGATGNILNKTAGGLGASVRWGIGAWTFDAEYIGAVKKFDATDLDVDADGSGDQPAAWNFELAYAINDAQELAFRYEGSREFDGFPELRYGIAGHWDVGDGVSLAAEYLHGRFNRTFSSGGDHESDTLTAQLAVAF